MDAILFYHFLLALNPLTSDGKIAQFYYLWQVFSIGTTLLHHMCQRYSILALILLSLLAIIIISAIAIIVYRLVTKATASAKNAIHPPHPPSNRAKPLRLTPVMSRYLGYIASNTPTRAIQKRERCSAATVKKNLRAANRYRSRHS